MLMHFTVPADAMNDVVDAPIPHNNLVVIAMGEQKIRKIFISRVRDWFSGL